MQMAGATLFGGLTRGELHALHEELVHDLNERERSDIHVDGLAKLAAQVQKDAIERAAGAMSKDDRRELLVTITALCWDISQPQHNPLLAEAHSSLYAASLNERSARAVAFKPRVMRGRLKFAQPPNAALGELNESAGHGLSTQRTRSRATFYARPPTAPPSAAVLAAVLRVAPAGARVKLLHETLMMEDVLSVHERRQLVEQLGA